MLLADRVFVLAPNPGRLVATLPVSIPRVTDELQRDKYDASFKDVLNNVADLLVQHEADGE